MTELYDGLRELLTEDVTDIVVVVTYATGEVASLVPKEPVFSYQLREELADCVKSIPSEPEKVNH